jgi:hypothetical protein
MSDRAVHVAANEFFAGQALPAALFLAIPREVDALSEVSIRVTNTNLKAIPNSSVHHRELLSLRSMV